MYYYPGPSSLKVFYFENMIFWLQVCSGKNTEKSPEGLRRLVVTQTPHLLMFVWKILKTVK